MTGPVAPQWLYVPCFRSACRTLAQPDTQPVGATVGADRGARRGHTKRRIGFVGAAVSFAS